MMMTIRRGSEAPGSHRPRILPMRRGAQFWRHARLGPPWHAMGPSPDEEAPAPTQPSRARTDPYLFYSAPNLPLDDATPLRANEPATGGSILAPPRRLRPLPPQPWAGGSVHWSTCVRGRTSPPAPQPMHDWATLLNRLAASPAWIHPHCPTTDSPADRLSPGSARRRRGRWYRPHYPSTVSTNPASRRHRPCAQRSASARSPDAASGTARRLLRIGVATAWRT